MEHSGMKKVLLGIFFWILTVIVVYGKTISVDVVTITKSDTYLTDQDIRDGNKKTGTTVNWVKMSHQKHEDTGVKCISCHHKKGNDGREKQCAQCHKGGLGRTTMHNACMPCHKTEKKGPTDCNECHMYQKE